MKKINIVFLLALLASSCTAKSSNNAKKVFEYLKDGFALIGELKELNTYLRNSDDPSSRVVASEAIEGTFEMAFTDNFYYYDCTSQLTSSFTRYDRDENGDVLIYTLNPMTNVVDEIYGQDPATGNHVQYDDLFLNPFKKDGIEKEFKDNGKYIVNRKGFESFNIAELLYLSYKITAGTFDHMSIYYDGNKKPTKLEVCTIEKGSFSSQEHWYTGTFVDLDEMNIPQIPNAYEHVDEHDELQSLLTNLKTNRNYTLDITIQRSVGEPLNNKMYITPKAYFYDFDERDAGRIDNGSYIDESGALIDVKNSPDGLKIAGLPKPYRTIEDKFSDFWKYRAEMFVFDGIDTFTLGSEMRFYEELYNYVLPDYLSYSAGAVIRGTFKFKHTQNGWEYSYEASGANVSVKILNVGTTTMPFEISSLIPYVPFTTMLDYMTEQTNNSSIDYILRYNLLTGNNINILPFVDAPYGRQIKFDCIGDIATQQLVYAIGFSITFELDAEEEANNLKDAYLDILDNDEKYVYDDEKHGYVYQHDGVYFILTIELVEMAGFNYAVRYSGTNLNPGPSLEW